MSETEIRQKTRVKINELLRDMDTMSDDNIISYIQALGNFLYFAKQMNDGKTSSMYQQILSDKQIELAKSNSY